MSCAAIDRRAVLLGAASSCAALASPASASASEAGGSSVYTPPPGSLAGLTVLITGANTGLGLESAKRLAAGGARLVVTARTREKADKAVADVLASIPAEERDARRVLGVEIDLADLKSIASAPERLKPILSAGGGAASVDVLLNNAGVMAIPERITTRDGFERTVGVNHLGHFALTAALLPTLRRAPRGFRVVTVSSDAHKFVTAAAMREAIDGGRLEGAEYTAGGWGAYGLSKASNVLFTLELQRRFEASGLRASAVALHPGVVQTDLGRYIIGGVDAGDVRASETAAPPQGVAGRLAKGALDALILPVEKGANTQVFLSAAADAGGDLCARPAGVYYDLMRVAKATDAATDSELAARLWTLSEELTGVKMGV